MKKKILTLLALLMTAVTGAWAQSALTGFFTINADGDQVQFSSGNLQATYDGTSWSWAFATNQWDYIGNAVANNKINGNGTVSENGTVDLFGWVGASSNYTGAAQYGIVKAGTTNTYGNVADESLKSDWGNTIGTGWRTLTGDEWTYLFNTRTTGGTVGTTAQARYTHATINTDGTGVNGMILFPDGVDIAASEFSTLGTVNGNSAWGTRCTATQWTALADKGCVFLPAAGNRLGATMYFIGNRGFYWSSSPYTSNVGYTYNVQFFSGSLNAQDNNNRDGGLSVRLVKPYERPTYTVSLNDGEENPTTWTAKAGSATTFTALPQDMAEGKTVTLKYSGNRKVKTVTATTDAVPKVLVESITLNKTSTTIEVGKKDTLSVTEVLPANATDPTYTWKSSAESKATVNPETGEVTAVAVGTVTIYAEANDGSGVKGECAVTVKAAVPTLSQVTTSHIGYLVTTDGCLYATLTDVIAAGKTAVAMVAYAGNQSDCTHGLAIALANESNSMSMTAGVTECSNKNTTNPVAGGTWRLPSSKDWQYMCFGCGAEGSYVELNGNESFDCSGLVCLLSAALGNSLSTFSWSSTHKGGEDYFYLQVSGGTLSFFYTNSSETNAIRAVLAF